ARHYFDVGKSPLPAAYRTIADQDPRNDDDGGLKLYRLAGNRHRRVAHHRSPALNSPHEPTTNASSTSEFTTFTSRHPVEPNYLFHNFHFRHHVAHCAAIVFH